MAQLFPKWTNKIPMFLIAGVSIDSRGGNVRLLVFRLSKVFWKSAIARNSLFRIATSCTQAI
jgi:hypothetical protein